MGIGIFSDKHQQPSDAEIQAAIGTALPLWQGLIGYLREHYSVQEDFRFLYGKNYGWGLRFRVNRQLLTSLYPRKDGFAVQINLRPAAVEQAQAMYLGEHIRQAIERARPYPEGRWLFIVVETQAELRDIHQLLALRAAPIGAQAGT